MLLNDILEELEISLTLCAVRVIMRNSCTLPAKIMFVSNGLSHVLLPVSCNISCLEQLNDVSVLSCLSLILNDFLSRVLTPMAW